MASSGVPGLYISIVDQALVEAGYGSLAAGLSDLGLVAIDLTATASLELPALDSNGTALAAFADDAGARAYRAHAYEHGVEVSALGLPWVTPAAAHPEQLGGAAAVPAAMEVIGVGVARLTISQGGEGDVPPEKLARALAGELVPLLEEALPANVAFAVEAPELGDREPELHRQLLRETDSEYLGVALDPGGLYCAGMPLRVVYEVVSELAPHVCYTRCRNARRPEELRDEPVADVEARELYASELEAGDIDYARIASVLGRVGYAGTMAVAADFRDGAEPEDRQQLLRRDVAYLKDVLGEDSAGLGRGGG